MITEAVRAVRRAERRTALKFVTPAACSPVKSAAGEKERAHARKNESAYVREPRFEVGAGQKWDNRPPVLRAPGFARESTAPRTVGPNVENSAADLTRLERCVQLVPDNIVWIENERDQHRTVLHQRERGPVDDVRDRVGHGDDHEVGGRSTWSLSGPNPDQTCVGRATIASTISKQACASLSAGGTRAAHLVGACPRSSAHLREEGHGFHAVAHG